LCKKRSFESTPKGKFEFINEILQDDLNKNMDIEDSIPALSVQLSVSMIYVKYCQQRAQRKRPETRRIWYNEGARKRLEYVQQKIVSA
jgi:hypothetical protein